MSVRRTRHPSRIQAEKWRSNHRIVTQKCTRQAIKAKDVIHSVANVTVLAAAHECGSIFTLG